jgi:hypothetical protein
MAGIAQWLLLEDVNCGHPGPASQRGDEGQAQSVGARWFDQQRGRFMLERSVAVTISRGSLTAACAAMRRTLFVEGAWLAATRSRLPASAASTPRRHTSTCIPNALRRRHDAPNSSVAVDAQSLARKDQPAAFASARLQRAHLLRNLRIAARIRPQVSSPRRRDGCPGAVRTTRSHRGACRVRCRCAGRRCRWLISTISGVDSSSGRPNARSARDCGREPRVFQARRAHRSLGHERQIPTWCPSSRAKAGSVLSVFRSSRRES